MRGDKDSAGMPRIMSVQIMWGVPPNPPARSALPPFSKGGETQSVERAAKDGCPGLSNAQDTREEEGRLFYRGPFVSGPADNV